MITILLIFAAFIAGRIYSHHRELERMKAGFHYLANEAQKRGSWNINAYDWSGQDIIDAFGADSEIRRDA